MRGLRSRPGDGAVGMKGDLRRDLEILGDVSNIIIDHCSLSWGVDEGITIYADLEGRAPHQVTIQWCFITEGLNRSIHPDGPHSTGVCLGGGNIHQFSLHHNLLAHNNARNPRIVWGAAGELINNVIYNWGQQAAIIQPFNPVKIKKGLRHPAEEAPALINVIGNCWIAGPDSEDRPEILLKLPSTGTSLYLEGNLGPHRPGTRGRGDEAAILDGKSRRKGTYVSTTQPAIAPSGVAVQTAERAKPAVLLAAGAIVPERDAVDRRVARDVLEGTGRVIDSPSQVGGYPRYAAGSPPPDSDRDGMPDAWETVHRLDILKADADGRGLDSRFDNIEVYINSLFPQTSGRD